MVNENRHEMGKRKLLKMYFYSQTVITALIDIYIVCVAMRIATAMKLAASLKLPALPTLLPSQ